MSMLRNAIDALRAAEEEWFGEEIAYVPLGGVRYEVAAPRVAAPSGSPNGEGYQDFRIIRKVS